MFLPKKYAPCKRKAAPTSLDDLDYNDLRPQKRPLLENDARIIRSPGVARPSSRQRSRSRNSSGMAIAAINAFIAARVPNVTFPITSAPGSTQTTAQPSLAPNQSEGSRAGGSSGVVVESDATSLGTVNKAPAGTDNSRALANQGDSEAHARVQSKEAPVQPSPRPIIRKEQPNSAIPAKRVAFDEMEYPQSAPPRPAKRPREERTTETIAKAVEDEHSAHDDDSTEDDFFLKLYGGDPDETLVGSDEPSQQTFAPDKEHHANDNRQNVTNDANEIAKIAVKEHEELQLLRRELSAMSAALLKERKERKRETARLREELELEKAKVRDILASELQGQIQSLNKKWEKLEKRCTRQQGRLDTDHRDWIDDEEDIAFTGNASAPSQITSLAADSSGPSMILTLEKDRYGFVTSSLKAPPTRATPPPEASRRGSVAPVGDPRKKSVDLHGNSDTPDSAPGRAESPKSWDFATSTSGSIAPALQARSTAASQTNESPRTAMQDSNSSAPVTETDSQSSRRPRTPRTHLRRARESTPCPAPRSSPRRLSLSPPTAQEQTYEGLVADAVEEPSTRRSARLQLQGGSKKNAGEKSRLLKRL